MKLYRKLIVLIASIITLCTVANAIDIIVNVRWQWLIIWTPANIQLGSFSNSKTVDFTDYFWIEDLRWYDSWHYTTIQWLLYWSDGNIISGASVEFKTNSENIILIWGIQDDTDFNRNLVNYTDITDPKLLFYRNDKQNNIWYLNRYGFKPSVKVTLPSGAPSGPYKLKLTYTLYDMSTNVQ